jgi:tetratricopeptide (TPR) repeat protein
MVPSLAASAGAATPAGSPAAKSMSQAGTYLAARHAEATSDDSKAALFLNRALEYDPANESILRHTYFLGAQTGDFNSAAAAALKSTDGTPQLALAPLIVTVNAFQKKKYDVAWSYLEKIPTQSAVGFALPMLRAWGMAPRQPVEAALAELAPLQGLNGAADLFNAMSGEINEYYGRTEQALVNYDTLAGRADQLPPSILRIVVEAYRRMGKEDKAKDLIAHFTDGRRSALFVDGILDASATAGRAPRRITPQEGMAEALFAACQMLLQNVNTAFGTQLAVVYGQAALYLNPDLSIARRVVAANLADRERLDEANALLSVIKKDQLSYSYARLQMSENYERMDKPAESLALLEEVAKERPDWPNVYVAIGDHMRRVKKFTESVEAYDHAFKLYPQGEPGLWQLYYARGIALERTKQWDRADADFRKALALKPDDAGVLNYLGYSLIDRGIKISEGRALIEKAFKLKPDDGYIIDSLGWAMYLMGETENAVVHLEKAVETNPSDPTINDHLGDAYWKAGRKHEAFFQWRRALGLDPDEEQRAGLQQKLAQGLARN